MRERKDGASLFLVIPSSRMRGHVHRLKGRKFHLNIEKNVLFFLAVRLILHWHKLPREIPTSATL